MRGIIFEFNQAKAIEAILYLSNKVSDPDKYGICKLLYLADKLSLEKYGRFIFGESYVAMKEGATPSNAYNLLKRAACNPVGGLKVEANRVIPLREPALDWLSESDIECLDQIISKYGNQSLRRRRDAHDGAWQKSWNKRGSKRSVRMPVESIAKLFPDSADLIGYLSNSDVV